MVIECQGIVECLAYIVGFYMYSAGFLVMGIALLAMFVSWLTTRKENNIDGHSLIRKVYNFSLSIVVLHSTLFLILHIYSRFTLLN